MRTINFQNRTRTYHNDDWLGMSEEAIINLQSEYEIIEHFYLPISRQDYIYEFYGLVKQWMEGRNEHSSLTEICTHYAYQRIIGMGEKVVPLILIELDKELDHWFWALKAITGQDPTSPEQKGDFESMRHTWLGWGRKNNLI